MTRRILKSSSRKLKQVSVACHHLPTVNAIDLNLSTSTITRLLYECHAYTLRYHASANSNKKTSQERLRITKTHVLPPLHARVTYPSSSMTSHQSLTSQQNIPRVFLLSGSQKTANLLSTKRIQHLRQPMRLSHHPHDQHRTATTGQIISTELTALILPKNPTHSKAPLATHPKPLVKLNYLESPA